MKAYWDSSALIQTHLDEVLHDRLKREGGFTRTHSLSEVFGTMSGNKLEFRLDANDVANTIENLFAHLEFVDLTPSEIVQALKKAQAHGVGRARS